MKWILTLLIFVWIGVAKSEKPGFRLLSSFDETLRPWQSMEAWSRRLPPNYLGRNPYSLAYHDLHFAKDSNRTQNVRSNEQNKFESRPRNAATHAQLFDFLRPLISLQLEQVLSFMLQHSIPLPPTQFYLETWPGYNDDYGCLNWVFARYWALENASNFKWFDLPDWNPPDPTPINFQCPVGAFQVLRPWNSSEWNLIWQPAAQADDLYAQPQFGNCLWSQELSGAASSIIWPSWQSEAHSNQTQRLVIQHNSRNPENRLVCRAMNPPARFNGVPKTFVAQILYEAGQSHPQIGSGANATVKVTKLEFEDIIEWIPVPTQPASSFSCATQIVERWPVDFEQQWRNELIGLTGAAPVIFPISKQQVTFSHKNSGDPKNRLEIFRRYLEERYSALKLKTFRIPTSYLGIADANVVGVLPGTQSDLAPILMCDHYDTAYAEDIFQATGKRVSVPGADDNDSATATLLQGASILAQLQNESKPFARDIWFVHLTGEEYPTDDLGARALVDFLASGQKEIGAIVLMDMIAYNNGSSVFQISPGNDPVSLNLATCAQNASVVSPFLTPVLRHRFDIYSYIYNTDGIIFSEFGFPVVFFNEPINRWQNFDEPFNHQSTDTVSNINATFGSAVAKVAIELVARLASQS